MSGFEVVGVVLSVVPLVISALEHYEEGVSTIRRYQHYKREVRDIILALQTEQVFYRNICEQLLSDIVNPVDLESLLRDPGGPLWSRPHVSRKLRTRLGNSHDIYITRVQDAMSAIEQFKQRLDLDKSGRVNNLL